MDYLNCMALVILLGLSSAYIVKCLLLEEKDSHEGPFRSNVNRVKFIGGHIQSVALFDYVRRAFGVYSVEGNYWTVREDRNRTEIFTCPHCLSFYCALPSTLLFAATIGLNDFLSASITVMAHFAIAIVSQIAYKLLWEID